MTSLPVQDRLVYRELFSIADVEKKRFLIKRETMSFFSKTGIPGAFLEEIWETADQEQKDYITELEFYIALKLIACAQNGIEANDDILSTRVPVPQFQDITLKSELAADIEPITANERDAYIGVFHSCNPIDGLLYGEQAIEIFNKSNLPAERLADIWTLADTRNSGTLNKTEFIIAMHYINRLMKDPKIVLPLTLPSQVYAEATGRFASSIRRHNTTLAASSLVNRSRASSNASLAGYTSPSINHMITGPTTSITSTSATEDIVLTSEEKEKYQDYFRQLDTDGSGFIDADEAVYFFNYSQLPNSELGKIWEIADSRHVGKLNLHDFCIAMHLINMRKRGESIEQYESILIPAVQNQHIQTQADLNLRYELENQLIELKQQINHESKRIADYQVQQEQEQECIKQLTADIMALKLELTTSRQAAENAESLLEVEQKKHRELMGISSLESSLSSMEQKVDSPMAVNVPELTRALSSFSGNSSIMSPRNDFGTISTAFDPFAGFKKMSKDKKDQEMAPPLSPTQSKAISKYGFDITAFDALSIEDNNQSQQHKPSIKDDLVALFGSPTTESTTNHNINQNTTSFDSIFL